MRSAGYHLEWDLPFPPGLTGSGAGAPGAHSGGGSCGRLGQAGPEREAPGRQAKGGGPDDWAS